MVLSKTMTNTLHERNTPKLTNAISFLTSCTIVRCLRINILTRRPSLPGRICWKGSRKQWVRKAQGLNPSNPTFTGVMTRTYISPVLITLIFLFTTYRTAIGIRVKDGVVLAVEKLIQSKLLVPGANRRIQNVDRHVGIVMKRQDSPL